MSVFRQHTAITILVTWTAGCALFVAISNSASAERPNANGSEPILIVPSSKVSLQLAVPLPDEVKSDAARWQLVEIGGAKQTLPAQRVAAMKVDGTAAQSGGQLLATIPPDGDAEGPRRFRLIEDKTSTKGTKGGFHLREISDKSLGLWEGDKPVLVYNHGVITGKDVPVSDSRRRRACYVHPLWGLDGELLTDDFPRDHYHHHGIFWTWPQVTIDGKKYDLWMYKNIQQRFVRWIDRRAGPLAGVLAVENGWFVGERKVMIERVWIRSFQATGGSRAIDLDFVWTPVDRPITLQGQGRKSYGGLTVRFDVSPRRDAKITTSADAARPESNSSAAKKVDLVNTPLAWADLTSKFPGAKARSGAAVFAAPDHPNFPPTWLTRHYGALCVGWPGVKPRTFAPGKPFRLSYRIWIHKKDPGAARIQQAYQAYATTAQAQWE
ncbi:MAG: PmoA family protein [Planctomycetes bacterium]|nr:PmoA family protein [Planctomycetota bacterium]